MSQVWVGGTPSQVWWVLHSRSGWWGVTQRTPPDQVWIVGGTWGIPPNQVWIVGVWGVPLIPIRQRSIASTCYAAGGVPHGSRRRTFLIGQHFQKIGWIWKKNPENGMVHPLHPLDPEDSKFSFAR